MKTIRNLSLLFFLLFAASSQCFAYRSVQGVSKEQAEVLGVKVRAERLRDGSIGMRLEFMPIAKLEHFSYAELDITSDKRKLVSVTLKPLKQSKLEVVLYFSADPAFVEMSTLTIIVSGSTRQHPDGYSFAIKDFVDELTLPMK